MKIFLLNLKLVLVLISLTIFSSSCKKTPECELAGSGEITFVNSNPDPYNCYVNATYLGDVAPGSSVTFTLKAGTKQISVEQESGFTLYPNLFTGTRTLDLCEKEAFSF